jgi:uncharacterized protein YqeY
MASLELLSKIQQDMKAAMKENRPLVVSTLRLLQGQFLNKEKEKRYALSQKGSLSEQELLSQGALSQEEVIDTISAEVKKRQDSIGEFEKGNRKDLADKERSEMEVLVHYLPPQMEDTELRDLVKEAILSSGAKEVKEMGKVMALLAPTTKGRAQGSRVSAIVKEEISKMS